MEGAPSFPEDFGDSYAIEHKLGHGATSAVYLARDLENGGRLVAIKVLAADFALAVPRERFQREIETTARLNHPHIVTLFRSGRLKDDRPYFVMKYIEGETLHDHLERTGPLTVSEALRIARQVAGALDHAHRHNVIHRDIKPTNIMLEGDHTWVTDFGIARQYSREGTTITTTGTGVGTPAYMSPEQAVGEPNLDPRTDVFSLGCVLYQMLTGRMPFDAPDIHTVLEHVLTLTPATVRSLRPDVPEPVELLVNRAMAKHREDRFQTAADFAVALSLEGAGALTPTRTQPAKKQNRTSTRLGQKTVLTAIAVFTILVVAAWRVLARADLKADWYLITSQWDYGRGMDTTLNASRLLQDAFNQWKGITVMGSTDADASQRGQAAWYVRGSVSQVLDSVRVRAQLYSARSDSLVRERSVNLPATLVGLDAIFSRLADQLLFDDSVWSANGGRAGTRIVAARTAFARGLEAVRVWDLVQADSAFRQAADADNGYAQAQVWLAQVRYWSEAPVATWRSAVQRAPIGARELSERDALLQHALQAVADGSIPVACSLWRKLTVEKPHDFVGWYGLATCLSRDEVVLRDRRSASGWSFRGSYHSAERAYQMAFALLPSMHQALSANAYASVRRVLQTNSGAVRFGRALPPDSGTFVGQPTWQGDTLAVIPYRERVFADSAARIAADTRVALRKERELFHDIATSWSVAFPKSPDALEALAISLEQLEDPNAIATIRRARTLGATQSQRIRLAGDEVWMRVKFSLPGDLQGLDSARALADSLLAAPASTDTGAARILLSLAMLTGRITLAAALSRAPALVASQDVPPVLSKTALPLLVFAALGGPLDSVRHLEQEVARAIGTKLLDSEQPAERTRWLVRPARLVYPDYRFRSLSNAAATGDFLLATQDSLTQGDTAAVRRLIVDLRQARRYTAASDIAVEGIYAEARLLTESGDLRQAADWLDNYLNLVGAVSPETFSDPPNAGALTRAASLRADLGVRMHDEAIARIYAQAVATLWLHADEFLTPTVSRMRRIAAGQGT